MADPQLPFSPPKQERSRRTLEKLTTAALALIAENGVEETGVTDIVARAGSSVGSFYARFPGKEEFLRYLRARAWSDAEERWSRAYLEVDWNSLSLSALVEALVEFLVRAHREDLGLQWVLGSTSHEAGSPGRTFHERVLSEVRPHILSKSSQITHPAPERAIEFGYFFTLATIRAMTDDDQGSGSPFSDEEFSAELSRAFVHYLGQGLGPSAEEVEETAEFFDIWG